MQTLVDNDQEEILVAQNDMDGNALDRVGAVLKGAVERLEQIDKIQEAETLFNDEQGKSSDLTTAHTHEDEISHDLFA